MAKTYSFQKTEAGSWQSPKYIEATKKAIETLESEQYKNVLTEADFWQLTGKTKTGKIAYNGLIISHNGCLKINDALPEEKRFKPSCISVDINGYGGSLVYSYCNEDQGIFEVGEVSKSNCTNSYPYAMALKRCMDRVILKNSKLAYAGIYSDSEAEEFKNDPKEEKAETETEAAPTVTYDTYPQVIIPEGTTPRKYLVDYCKERGIDINEVARVHKLNNKSPDFDFIETIADLMSIYD